MDDPNPTTSPPLDDDLAAALDALEELMARDDADAARVSVLGETWAAERYWKLHVQAARLGHKLWAAKYRELHAVAVESASEARTTSRAASEQIEKVEERRARRNAERARFEAERRAAGEAREREAAERAREKAERRLGRPPTGDRVAARAAYENARREGSKVEAAIFAAMGAGGFKSPSRVYELKRAEGWE